MGFTNIFVRKKFEIRDCELFDEFFCEILIRKLVNIYV